MDTNLLSFLAFCKEVFKSKKNTSDEKIILIKERVKILEEKIEKEKLEVKRKNTKIWAKKNNNLS